MKVRVITPIRVGNEELARRQERYSRLAPDGWQLIVEDLPDTPDSPRELGSRKDISSSESAGLTAGHGTDASRFDAVMPDCVLDPSLMDLQAGNKVPVLGITRLSAGFLASLGTRFGVVTRNAVIAEEFQAVVEKYGLGAFFEGAYVLDLSVEDIADPVVWNTAVVEVARTAQHDGVTVLINGCSAVEVVFDELGIRVIDPTALALRVASLAHAERLL